MRRAIIILLSCTFACHKTRTFTLPDRPMKPSVAFVALYEGDRPREVGPVVPYQRIYSGAYSLEFGKTGLDARLFFVEESVLQREALERCGDLPDAVQKVACRDRVTACEDDASSCLHAVIRGEGCGDRLPLSGDLDVTEFRADSDGDLKAAPDDSASLQDLELCGPSLTISCPILLPGFVVTEDGRYRCTAPSRQRGCSLEVDMSVCGLGRASGVISTDGSFLPAVPVAGCASSALTEGEAISSGGGFAVECESRRFVASYMMRLIGEATCPRRGPTIYNNPLFDAGGSSDGFVRGVKFAHFPQWTGRLLFAGTGVDGCADTGCNLTRGCGECATECNELISLPDCANANSWDPCTMKDTIFECQKRCEDTCNKHEPFSTCAAPLEGHGLSVGRVDEPENAVTIVNLDDSTGSIQAATGIGSLVLVPHRGRTLVAVAARREVRLFQPTGADSLNELVPSAPAALDFDIAGVTLLSASTGELLIYGRTRDAVSTGVLMHVPLSDEQSPSISYTTRISLPLPTADAVALINGGETILAASLDPPLSNTERDVAALAVVGKTAGDPSENLRLDGAPTMLGAINGGAALVGVRRASGESTLDVVVPSGASARVGGSMVLPKGLVPTVALPDPKTCEVSGLCLTYVGFELEGANRDNGRAVVGIVEHDRSNPAGAKLIPSFIQTTSPELTLLEIDTERDVLYAIASAANRITPIQLAR